MEIIDREQERMAQEQTPQGKRKKLLTNLALAGALAVMMGYLYLSTHHPFFIGTPYVLQIQGITVEPGVTLVEQVAKAGYQLSDYTARTYSMAVMGMVYEQVYDLEGTADGKSYYYGIDVIKGNDAYAKMTALNPSNSAKPLSQCLVRNFAISDNHTNWENALLDGNALKDLTLDQLIAAYGDPSKQLESTPSETGPLTEYIWSKGYYSVSATFKEDGSLHQVESNYDRKD